MYRGTAAAARNYLAADRSRADDYYLAEGTGIASRFTTGRDCSVVELASLTGNRYEAWVGGLDPDTGQPRGRLRADASAVRFVEIVVNGPKSWSLAAELHPDVAAAYEAAQGKAAEQIITWLGEHATTRVGPRGVDSAPGDESVADRRVERGGVLPGVHYDRRGDTAVTCGRDLVGERLVALHFTAVGRDLATGAQRVEDRAGILAGPHCQTARRPPRPDLDRVIDYPARRPTPARLVRWVWPRARRGGRPGRPPRRVRAGR